MADDVVIGSASVQIVGDYSQLEKSFNESQNLAQQAGQKISAAFETSAAGASALTSAVNTVASSVEDFATKSGLAGGELNLFRAALQGSLEAGVPVNDALKDMAASSATLGTAVAGASQSLLKESEAAGASAQALTKEAAAAGTAATANQQASASFTNLGKSAEQANTDFAKFAEGVQNFISHPLQSAGSAAKEFLTSIGPMGAVALAGAAALAAVGKELFNLVEAYGQAAEATGNMADRLNLTWRETRDLEEMAQIAGVSIGGLQTASFRLAEALEGTSAQGQKTAEALLNIGVAGSTSGELLTGFLQKLAEIPDDTQRIALAHEVLGKSSQQILPLIKNYGELQEAIQHLGPAIDSNMAKKLMEADDALDKLSISWNRFKEHIAVFAAPAVQKFVDTLTAFIAGGTMLTIEQQIGQIEAKMVSLGEKSALAGWLMADGFTKGKQATLEALAAERSLLVGKLEGIERSRELNAEIARSNAESARYTAAKKAEAEAEGKAAKAKAEHLDHVKALTKAMPPLSDATAIFVKQLELDHAAHQALINDSAALSNVLGRYVSITEMAALKTAAAATSYRILLEYFDETPKYLGNAEKIAPMMDEIAKSITEAAQSALNIDPYVQLQKALEELGIKSLGYYQQVAAEAEKNYQIVLDSGLATYEELAQAALVSVQKQIQLEMELGTITREEADKTLAQIQGDLDTLDASSEKSTKTRGHHEKTLGEEIQDINRKTFNALERGLAKSIVEVKGFTDLWRTLWKGLAEDLIQIMLKVVFKPLEDQFAKLAGMIPGLGGSASSAGSAAGGAGSAAGGIGGAASGAGGAAGAGGSLAASWIGAIGSAVSAVTGVIGVIQSMHQETTLNAIEKSTRYLSIGLVEQGDSLLNNSKVMRNTLTDMMSFMWDVQAKYLQGISEKLDALIGMGGVHSPKSMAMVSTFSASPVAQSEPGPVINVNIDTVESDVTDAKVTATMNRAIRMSKLSGAFPPGRFPQ